MRRVFATLSVIGVLSFCAAAPAAVAAPGDVCGPLGSGKIDTTGDPFTVTLTAPAGQVITGYCVKAGSAKQGDGPVYVELDPSQWASSIIISHPSGKAVSHYSFSVGAPAPAPAPEPEPEVPAPAPGGDGPAKPPAQPAPNPNPPAPEVPAPAPGPEAPGQPPGQPVPNQPAPAPDRPVEDIDAPAIGPAQGFGTPSGPAQEPEATLVVEGPAQRADGPASGAPLALTSNPGHTPLIEQARNNSGLNVHSGVQGADAAVSVVALIGSITALLAAGLWASRKKLVQR